MRYIFFYRYENGTEGFSFWEDLEDAAERMAQFKKDSSGEVVAVEFGIAEIEEVDSVCRRPPKRLNYLA